MKILQSTLLLIVTIGIAIVIGYVCSDVWHSHMPALLKVAVISIFICISVLLFVILFIPKK